MKRHLFGCAVLLTSFDKRGKNFGQGITIIHIRGRKGPTSIYQNLLDLFIFCQTAFISHHKASPAARLLKQLKIAIESCVWGGNCSIPLKFKLLAVG